MLGFDRTDLVRIIDSVEIDVIHTENNRLGMRMVSQENIENRLLFENGRGVHGQVDEPALKKRVQVIRIQQPKSRGPDDGTVEAWFAGQAGIKKTLLRGNGSPVEGEGNRKHPVRIDKQDKEVAGTEKTGERKNQYPEKPFPDGIRIGSK
ncbi:MAG: hypothetical protein WAM61_15180 [Desulfobacterales bacterium]